MSILVENEHGCVICHQKAVDEVYEGLMFGTKECERKLKFKSDLFDISTPFRMDSQMSKGQNESLLNCDQTDIQKKRKRKRKEPLNDGELSALQFHEKIKDTIQKAHASLVSLAQTRNYFTAVGVLKEGDNNRQSRKAAACVGPRVVSLAELCTSKRKEDIESIQEFHQGEDTPSVGPVDVVWKYSGEISRVVNIFSEQYILPPRSTFLLSDLSGLQKNYHNLGKSNLIVIDPPWQNKSAKRLKTYWTLKNEDIVNLPITELTDDSCLVIVWATNKQSQLQFIQETLFPAWGVKYLAHWVWLKITKTGETVYDLESPHKKPYESIIIGHSCSSIDQCQHKANPTNNVVTSVPCSLHSKKPPLMEVLKPYLPDDPRCLELFARNLWPDWTSWGNEVLIHQHIDFFESVT